MNDLTSIMVSMKLSLVTTLLLIIICLPLSYLFSRVSFFGKSLVEGVLTLPLVLPPTVLGYYLLVGMGPRSTLGTTWETLFGSRLVFSFSGLVLASLIYSLPFAFMPLKAAMEKIDPRMIESAYMLGCSKTAAFFRVVLPNTLVGIGGAMVLVFAHTMGEFGVALMIGGSIPGETKVAAIAIFEFVETLQYSKAGLLSLILLVMSYLILITLSRLKSPGRV